MGIIRKITNSVIRLVFRAFIVLFFVALAAILIWFGVSMKQADKKKAVYPKTEATIISIETHEETDDDGNKQTVGDSHFEYTVDGTTYENFKAYEEGEQNGDKFELYYNPDDPEEIIVGDTSIGNILIIAGAVCGVIALFSLAGMFFGKNGIFR